MEALLEALNGFSSKPLTEVEVRVSKLNYLVKTYNRNNKEDEQYIKANKVKIKNFMDAGYAAAGLGSFESCQNENSVAKNTIMLKVAETLNGEILAMSLYSGRMGGFKCVGITKLVTNNQSLAQLAKDAIKHIIKEDISNFQDFVWTECSGAVEHLWDKYSDGWLRIPNIYLPTIFPSNVMKTVELYENDDYHYSRWIHAGPDRSMKIDKCIFGFPNAKILEDYIETRNITLQELIDKLSSSVVLEHMFTNVPNDINNADEIIMYICGFVEEAHIYELTEFEMKMLVDSIDLITKFVKERGGRLTQEKREDLIETAEYGMDFANCCSILRPYSLVDDFISEQDIYTEQQQNYY